MRQTDFCLEKLKNELEEPKTGFPRCLIVNEIGVLLLIGEKNEPDEAEKILSELLESELEEDRFLAYCFLSDPARQDLEDETQVKLKEFEEKEGNQEIIQLAQPEIERSKMKAAAIAN